MDRVFPESSSENRVICVPGIGSKKPFSALMTDTMPDLTLLKQHNVSLATNIRNHRISQMRQNHFSALMIHLIVLTTYQTQHYAPSVSITPTTQSQRTLSLTMFTAFCMPPVIVSSLLMIYLR